MKKILLLLFVLVFLSNAFSQSIDDFFELEHKVYDALGRDDDALSFKLSQELLVLAQQKYMINENGRDTLVRVPPFTALIGHALHYVKKNDLDSTYYYLDMAADEGCTDKLIFMDYFEDLYPIQYTAKTQAIKERMIENKLSWYHTPESKQLVKEVTNMFEKDLFARKNYDYCEKVLKYDPENLDALKEEWIQMDSANQKRMIAILDTYGYPGKSLVGYDNQDYAFFIIHHFPDLEPQKKYFPLLKEAAEQGEMSENLLMLIIDRMNLREGKEQVYGTQKVIGQEVIIMDN